MLYYGEYCTGFGWIDGVVPMFGGGIDWIIGWKYWILSSINFWSICGGAPGLNYI